MTNVKQSAIKTSELYNILKPLELTYTIVPNNWYASGVIRILSYNENDLLTVQSELLKNNVLSFLDYEYDNWENDKLIYILRVYSFVVG